MQFVHIKKPINLLKLYLLKCTMLTKRSTQMKRIIVLHMTIIMGLMVTLMPYISASGRTNAETIYFVKWTREPLHDPSYAVLDWSPETGWSRVAFHDMSLALERLKSTSDVQDIEEQVPLKPIPFYEIQRKDARVGIARRLDQYYLDALHVPEAWQITRGKDTTIAVVDTGVFSAHPALKGNVLPGINVIKEGGSTEDDNGHGTALASLLVAAQDEMRGVAPEAKVLPIKALDAYGGGDAYTVAKGILSAVREGANIVLLSLTDPVYSGVLADALTVAEKKGVLVVAATGNDGRSMLPYPARYPTVLAVGAVQKNGAPASYANYGQGLDVVAYGDDIVAASLDGGYRAYSGTSFAAPQVAGIAALLYNSGASVPAEVRDRLRQSAIANRAYPFKKIGFGVVDAYRALKSKDAAPLFSSNDRPEKSAPLALDKKWTLNVPGGADRWFTLDIPYDGTVTWVSDDVQLPIKLELYTTGGVLQESGMLEKGRPLRWNVQGGTMRLKLKNDEVARVNLSLTSTFKIKRIPAPGEARRDRPWPLEMTDRAILTGTLPEDGDEAWYRLTAPGRGKLSIRVATDDPALDLFLTVQKNKDRPIVIDENGVYNQKLFETYIITAEAGDELIIGVKNFYGLGVNAFYTLSLLWQPETKGLFKDVSTVHWAYPMLASLKEEGVTFGYLNDMVYPERPITRAEWADLLTKAFPSSAPLSSFEDQKHTVFPDLSRSNWAYEALFRAYQEGWLERYPDGTIRPNAWVTRREMVVTLNRLLAQPTSGSTMNLTYFKDVSWREPLLLPLIQLVNAGYISGYPDQTMRLSQPLRRVEALVIVYKLLKGPSS